MKHEYQGLDTDTYNNKRKQELIDFVSNNTSAVLQQEALQELSLPNYTDIEPSVDNVQYQTKGEVKPRKPWRSPKQAFTDPNYLKLFAMLGRGEEIPVDFQRQLSDQALIDLLYTGYDVDPSVVIERLDNYVFSYDDLLNNRNYFKKHESDIGDDFFKYYVSESAHKKAGEEHKGYSPIEYYAYFDDSTQLSPSDRAISYAKILDARDKYYYDFFDYPKDYNYLKELQDLASDRKKRFLKEQERIDNEQMIVNDQKQGNKKSPENYLDKELWIGDSKYRVESYRDWGKNSWRLTQIDPETGEDIDTRSNRKKLQLTDEDMERIFTDNQNHGYLSDNGIFRQRYGVVDEGNFDREFFYDPVGNKTIEDWRTENPDKVPLYKKGDDIRYITDKGRYVHGDINNFYKDKDGNLYYDVKYRDFSGDRGNQLRDRLSYNSTPYTEGSDYIFPLTQKQKNDYEENGYPVAIGNVVNYSIPENLSKDNYESYLKSYESQMKKEGYSKKIINNTIETLRKKFNNKLEIDDKEEQVPVVTEVITETKPKTKLTKTKKDSVPPVKTKTEIPTKNDDIDVILEDIFLTGGENLPKKDLGGNLYDQKNALRHNAVVGLGEGIYKSIYGLGEGINQAVNNYNNNNLWSWKINENNLPENSDGQVSIANHDIAQAYNSLPEKQRSFSNLYGAVYSMYPEMFDTNEEESEETDEKLRGGSVRLRRCQAGEQVPTSDDMISNDEWLDKNSFLIKDKYQGRAPFYEIAKRMYGPSVPALTKLGTLMREPDYTRYKQNEDMSQLANIDLGYIGYPMEQFNTLGDINTQINGKRVVFQPGQQLYI